MGREGDTTFSSCFYLELAMGKAERTEAWKDEVALALLLWKDFKCNGTFDVEITRTVLLLADDLEVRKEFENLTRTCPPFKITQK